MNNFINLAHLKFFCDAVIYKNISEAAKMNFITQSAISQAINKLEHIYGVPLLTHNKQTLILTEYGKIVFDEATEIFKSVKIAFDKINQAKTEITGVVKFATTKSLGMSFFAPTYTKIQKNLPHVKLKIDMGGKSYIRTALKREEVECAIVVYDHNFSQFAKHTIKKGFFNLYQSIYREEEDRFDEVVACPNSKSWPGSGINSPENFINQGIFIDEYKGMHIDSLRNFFSGKGYSFEMEAISGWELVAHFTNLNIGVGFFPDYIASETRFPNLRLHSMKLPPFEYEIAAIYNKSTKLSRSAQAFIEQFTLDL